MIFTSKKTHIHKLGLILCTIGTTGLIGLIGGCVSYTNVPGPKSPPAFQSVNHTQSISVVARALSAVLEKNPPSGGYAINLPMGTSPETFAKIIAMLPAGAVMPFDGLNDGVSAELAVYHIGRIWIRASDAKVDVVYPFTGDNGVTSDQNMTVWLSGGVRSWRVHRLQHWAAGTIETPQMYVPMVEAEPVVETIEEPVEEAVEDSGDE